MTGERVLMVEITRLEAAHLAGLITQFADLLDDTASAGDDPAIARLVPDAYIDDADSAREFRALTERDLLARRRSDAAMVLTTLRDPAEITDDPQDPGLLETVEIALDRDGVQAWLRTLAAVRLVLADRLGIDTAEDHDDEDPRFGIYDWLGYRLHGLISAIDDHA